MAFDGQGGVAVLLPFALMGAAAGTGFAQDPDAAAPVRDIIVVTAQKRDQAIDEVPLAITAFGDAELNRLGVQQFDDLAEFVPGLQVQEQSANNPGFVIRGITSDDGAATTEPRVAIFKDGVPISRSRGSFVELYDTDVEVVRGPQPTLFGRSALIGAISIRSRAPETSNAFGALRVGGGNYDFGLVDGFWNLPLGDDVAVRAAGRYKQRTGYTENLIGEDLNGFETFAGRLSALWTPTPDLTMRVIGSYQKDDNPGTGFKSGTFLPVDGDGNVGTFGPGSPTALSAFGGFTLGLDREVYGVTGLLEWDFTEHLSLSSVTNWREFDSREVFDPDGSALPLFTFIENSTGEQIFQEFRLDFEDAARFSGFLGVSYFREEGEQETPLIVDQGQLRPVFAAIVQSLVGGPAPFPAPVGTVPGTIFADEDNLGGEVQATLADNETYDVFGDATFRVTDRFEITGGARYTRDDKRSGARADVLPLDSDGAPNLLLRATENDNVPVFVDGDFEGVTFRIAGRYEIAPGQAVFANYGRGRRPEVLQLVIAQAEPISADNAELVEAETVNSVDWGFRGQFWGGRMRTELVGYHLNYENFQSTIVRELAFVVENAGNASGFGFEGTVETDPFPWLTLFGTYSYTGVTFDEENAEGTPQPNAGNRFRLSPEHALALSATMSVETGAGVFSLTPIYTYRSEVFFDDANDGPTQTTVLDDLAVDEFQPGYGRGDIRARFAPEGMDVEIELFVQNVSNEAYLLDAGNVGDNFGIPTFIAAPPRTFGAYVKKSF